METSKFYFKEIISIEEKNLIGITKSLSYANGKKQFFTAWQEIEKQGYLDKLANINIEKELSVYALCINTDNKNFDYFVGVPNMERHKEFKKRTNIPKGDYAEFITIYEYIDEAYNYVFKEWLPNSKYHLRHNRIFEQYKGKSKCSIFVPVDERF